MIEFDYDFTENDISTLLSALSILDDVFPSLDIPEFSPEEKLLTMKHSKSAMIRLKNRTDVTHNDMSAVHIALQVVDMINCGEFTANENISKQCADISVSVKKLLPVFDEF